MSYKFYFEDGAGNIVDENGEDPMDIIEDRDPFKLEELTSYTEYLTLRAQLLDSKMLPEIQPKKKEKGEKKISDGETSSKAKGNRVSNEIKARAVHLVDVHPKNSAGAVALDLKLEPRTVQRWYKTWKEDPDSLFKTIGRPKIIEPEGELAEATKKVVSDFYFKQPTSTMDQLMEQLNTSFSDLTISKITLYRYMADLWLFSLERVCTEPEDRNSPEKIQQRKECVEDAYRHS